MKFGSIIFVLFSLLMIGGSGSPFILTRVIDLPGIHGRVDHMDIDTARRRLYIAAHDAGRLIIVDIKSGRMSEIAGLKEPQGVLYVPGSDKVIVTNGGDGNVFAFNGSTHAQLDTISLGSDADNIRYDPGSGLAYIGYGSGGVAIVSSTDLKLLQKIPLGAHPESFFVDALNRLLYVNIPDAGAIAVVDISKRRVINRWKIREAHQNFPLAWNPAGRELFVGCREPSVILILDASAGRTIQKLEISSDVDDIWYDPSMRRLYASCGSGFVHVFRQAGEHQYVQVARIATARGARTSLYVPSESSLYVAVPGSNKEKAHIFVFRTSE